MGFEAWLLTGVGIFTIICAAGDFDFFMEHRKAQFLSRIVGRVGARIFYALIGMLVAGTGIAGLMGHIR